MLQEHTHVHLVYVHHDKWYSPFWYQFALSSIVYCYTYTIYISIFSNITYHIYSLYSIFVLSLSIGIYCFVFTILIVYCLIQYSMRRALRLAQALA